LPCASDGSAKLFVFLNLDERPSCRTERSLPSPALGRTFRRIRLRCAAGFIAAGWRIAATGIARMADRLGSGGPHRPHPTPPEKAAPTPKGHRARDPRLIPGGSARADGSLPDQADPWRPAIAMREEMTRVDLVDKSDFRSRPPVTPKLWITKYRSLDHKIPIRN